MTSSQPSQGFAGSKNFTFLLGRVHSQIGGPTRTILGYVRGLHAAGSSSTIAGLGSQDELRENFSDKISKPALDSISGNVLQQFVSLWRVYKASSTTTPIVLVGVWHLPFFVVGMIHLVSTRVLGRHNRRLYLIPTMSLIAYDWQKRRRLKSFLRPLVSSILSGLDGVVFASTGEQNRSEPKSWRRSRVILHPSIAIDSSTSDKNRQNRSQEVLFAGRIDAQKDLPLLIKSLALTETKPSLTIAGDGDKHYVEEIQNYARSLGYGAKIAWLGWQSHHQTLELFRTSRLVVVTSLVENFCHTAVEALVSECELVLVDRVMSAPDFAKLADLTIVSSRPEEVAGAIDDRLVNWSLQSEQRILSSRKVMSACVPASAAAALVDFAQHNGTGTEPG